MEIRSSTIRFLLGAMAITIAARLIPHPPNFVPVAALALYAGAYTPRLLSISAPLIVMFLSDLLIGFYSLPLMLAVYAGFVLISLIGWQLKKRVTAAGVIGAALGGAIVFFLITNWAVWQFSSWYPHSLGGLIYSYILALPFFRNSLMAFLAYSAVFFGVQELLFKRQFSWSKFAIIINKFTSKSLRYLTVIIKHYAR